MGLIQKRDEEDKDYVDGIDIVESGDVPSDGDKTVYDLVEGQSAEDIAGRNEEKPEPETEPDPELVGDAPDEDEDGGDEPDAGAAQSDEDGDGDDYYPEPYDDSDEDDGSSRARTAFIVIAVVAVIVAAVAGYVVGGGSLGSSSSSSSSSTSSSTSSSDSSLTTSGTTTLTEDELDAVVATYTYDGVTVDVTAQEALESQYSLESLQNDDGTYPVPSADIVLSYVRNMILTAEAESLGYEVTEDEIAEYAETYIGTSDYDEIAEAYSLTAEQAESIVSMSALLQKMYDDIVPEVTAELPDAPSEPEDDAEDEATAEYGAYIIELLGDEWDSESGTWASTDGIYYESLGEEDFSEDAATYTQALIAYYVAYTAYLEEYDAVSDAWTEFSNALYAQADITIYGLTS